MGPLIFTHGGFPWRAERVLNERETAFFVLLKRLPGGDPRRPTRAQYNAAKAEAKRLLGDTT